MCIAYVARAQCLERPLRVVKVREILKVIEDEGWYQVRQTGSHRQFHHPTHRGCVTVAGHLSRDLPEWIVNSIMKQAGISRGKK
jgi:predicted RNA binding protein YcfA (HicA-like mRNA interferase family)